MIYKRIKGVKVLYRKDINDLTELKSPMTGYIGYGLNYNTKKSSDATPLDYESGKAILNWYHNEDERKQEEAK
jgi:hypothetical protein